MTTKLTEEEIEKLRQKHLEPHDYTKIVKVGDILSVRKDSHERKIWYKSFVGKVTECSMWEKCGPLSIENHGSIEVEILEIKSQKPNSVKVGDLEHFTYWKWYETFEVINDHISTETWNFTSEMEMGFTQHCWTPCLRSSLAIWIVRC